MSSESDPLMGSSTDKPQETDRPETKSKGSGRTAAFVQVLQGNLGPGILTLPYIFTTGGVVITSAMLATVLLLTLYSMSLVLNAKKWVHKSKKWINVADSQRPQSFQAVGRELLGKTGEKIIICFVVLMQLGICMVFLNFSAENMIAVEAYFRNTGNITCLPLDPDGIEGFVPYDGDNDTDDGLPYCDDNGVHTITYVMIAVVVGMLAEVFAVGISVKSGVEPIGAGVAIAIGTAVIGAIVSVMATVGSLSKPELVFATAPLSLALSLGRSSKITVVSAAMATSIMYTSVGTVFFLVGSHFLYYYPGTDAIQVHPKKPYELPIVFGNLVYTVTTSIGILLPIENTLNARARAGYGVTVKSAMTCALILFLATGLLSNIAFGPQTEISVTAEFIKDDIGYPLWIVIINCLLALSVLLTFPLQFRPASEVVEMLLHAVPDSDVKDDIGLELEKVERKQTFWARFGYIPVRAVLVIITAVVAAFVPQLDLIVAFAGSLTSCVLAMMIPPAMDIAMMRADGHYSMLRMPLDCIVIFVGVGGLLGGSAASLMEIIGIDVCDILASKESCDDSLNPNATNIHALLPGMFRPYH